MGFSSIIHASTQEHDVCTQAAHSLSCSQSLSVFIQGVVAFLGNMADVQTFHDGDLFPYLKRLFCEALRTVNSLNRSKLDSCSLKFNKRLVNGDLIIPAFVRTCLGDVMNDNKVS